MSRTPSTSSPASGPALAPILRALFIAYLAATAIHIGFVVLHEPFTYDAWNVAIASHSKPFSLRAMSEYVRYEYAHDNPRIGQWFTYLAYKLTWFAPIATPIAFLALSLAVTVLGLGRRPSWRRGRDLALWAIALGSLWFALPRIGMLTFSSSFCAHYVYGAAIQLWFLLAVLHGQGLAGSWRSVVAYGGFGLAAGMTNEHSGPTLILFVLGCAVRRQRRTGRAPRHLYAGVACAVIGYAVIFFAPGQQERYEQLATKVSLLGRLLQRGITNNLDIYREFVIGCAPVLALIAVALVMDARCPDDAAPEIAARRRAALRFLGRVAVAGSAIVATLFASPKLGPKFYLHSCALVLAGLVAVLDAVAVTPRRLAPFAVLAVLASAYAGVRTVPLFLRLHEQSAERLVLLGAAPRGAMVTIESLDQVDDNWWFLGDDLRTSHQREMVSTYLGLGGMVFRAVDLDAPFGVSDLRLVPHYRVTPAECLDDHASFEITGFRGLDVRSIQNAMLEGVARTRARLGPSCRLDRLDLAVELIGSAPALPRKTLLVGSWTPEHFEAWAGSIERRGVTRLRTVALPKELRETDLEIFVYHLGGPSGGVARRLGTARDAALDYLPWARGGYWALACNADECFVIAAARVL